VERQDPETQHGGRIGAMPEKGAEKDAEGRAASARAPRFQAEATSAQPADRGAGKKASPAAPTMPFRTRATPDSRSAQHQPLPRTKVTASCVGCGTQIVDQERGCVRVDNLTLARRVWAIWLAACHQPPASDARRAPPSTGLEPSPAFHLLGRSRRIAQQRASQAECATPP